MIAIPIEFLLLGDQLLLSVTDCWRCIDRGTGKLLPVNIYLIDNLGWRILRELLGKVVNPARSLDRARVHAVFPPLQLMKIHKSRAISRPCCYHFSRAALVVAHLLKPKTRH